MGVKKVVHTVCTKCAQSVQNSKSWRVKNQPLFTSFRGWLWAPGYRSTGKNDGQKVESVAQPATPLVPSTATWDIGALRIDSAITGGPPPLLYSDFENSTDGTNATTAILAAGTHAGNGAWTLTSSAAIKVSTSGEKTLHSSKTVAGTSYADSSGTRGLRMDAAQASQKL